MPNRIIKESAFTSDKVAQLTDFEFRLWVGMITQADDAGRGDARPAILKGRIFALRERTTVKDIESALLALAAAGCVSLYKVSGKPYFQFPNWSAHQRIRDCKPKYPGVLRRLAANCRLNPIQSNPIRILIRIQVRRLRRHAPDLRSRVWKRSQRIAGRRDTALMPSISLTTTTVTAGRSGKIPCRTGEQR